MFALPKAEPQAYSLDAVASVLGSGIAARGLDVHLGAPPVISQAERDLAINLALADRLSVEPSAVRVVLGKPQSLVEAHGSLTSKSRTVADDMQKTVRATSEMPDHIAGDFTAAMRLNDEQWRVVRPASLARNE